MIYQDMYEVELILYTMNVYPYYLISRYLFNMNESREHQFHHTSKDNEIKSLPLCQKMMQTQNNLVTKDLTKQTNLTNDFLYWVRNHL